MVKISDLNLDETSGLYVEDTMKTRAKKILDIAGVFIVLLDRRGCIQFINRRASEILGIPVSDAVGLNWFDNYIPSEKKQVIEVFNQIMKGQLDPYEYNENPIITCKGVRMFQWHNAILRENNGEISGSISSGIDITERLEYEKKYRRLFEESNDAVIIHTLQGDILDVNERAEELLGYNKDELVHIKLPHLHSGEEKILAKKVENLKERGSARFENKFTRSDGSILDVEISSRIVDPENHIFQSIIRDNSIRKKYEQRLQSIHKHSTLMATAGSLDEIADIINQTLENVIGFSRGSFSVIEGNELCHKYVWHMNGVKLLRLPLDGPGITVRAARTGDSQLIPDVDLDPDYFTADPDRKNRTRSELAIPIKTSDAVLGLINLENPVVNSFTIEDQKLLEIYSVYVASAIGRLKEDAKKQKYSDRLEALHQHLSTLNTAQTEEAVIENTLELLADVLGFENISYIKVLDSSIKVFATKAWKSESLMDFEIPLDGIGITVNAAVSGEIQLVNNVREEPDFARPPGLPSYQPATELVVPVKVDERVVALIDVYSERVAAYSNDDVKILEIFAEHVAVAFRRLQYLEHIKDMHEQHNVQLSNSYQRVSSMVRHDLRNPLSSINLAVDFLKKNPDSTENMYELIEKNIKYAHNIMEDWRHQTLTGELKIDGVNISDMVNNVMNASVHNEDIIIETDISQGLEFRIDKNRFERVLGNLVKNALEAMPEGGSLSIESYREGDTLQVIMSDSGVGMSEEVMNQIFTPFFTTKPDGMGLGLAYCKQAVEAHNGIITVDSEEGKGTKFLIQIPESDSQQNGHTIDNQVQEIRTVN